MCTTWVEAAADPGCLEPTSSLLQVFPYFFVPYEGPEPLKRKPNGAVDEPEDDEDDALTDECRLYVYRLGASIDRALSTFLNRDPTDPIKSQHVRAIRLVKGIPFYGFHSSYAFFLKVYFLDPSSATKAEKLMQQGAVMGRTFDIYESHFPYGLQFMLDHNLYGMDLMNLANLRFRQPGVLNIEVARDRSAFLNNSSRLVKKYSWSHDSSPTRQSEMDLELDVWASDICNRDAVPERPEEALIDFSQRKDRVPSRKHVPSVDAIWEDERERRRRAGKDPTEVDAGVEKENHVPRDPEPPGPAEGQPRQMRWGGEKELWDEIDDQLSTAFAARESGSEAKVRKALENLFPKLDDLDGGIVQTLWQAVELLWPSSLPWREEEHVVSAPATPRRLDSRGSLLQTPAVSVRRGRPSMTPWEAAERLRPGLTQGFRGGMSTPLGSEGPGGEIGDEIVVDEQLISEIAAKAAATPRTKPNAKLISSPFAGTPINLAARQTVPTPDRAVREDLLDALVDIPEELERDLERAQTQEPDESDENPDEEILVHDDLVEENYGGFELQGAHDEEEDEYQDVGWDGAADETEFLEDNFGEVFAYASSGIAKPGDPEAPEDSPKAGSSRKRTFAQYDGPAFDDFNDFDSPRQSRKSLSSVGKRNRTTLVRAKDREPVLHSPVNAAPNDLLMWSSSPSSQGDGLPSQEIFGSPPRFVSPEPERSKTVVMDDVTETFETRVPTEAPPGQTPCVEEAHSSPLSALFVPKILPPKPTDLLNTLQAHRTPEVVHRKPFYSDPKDVPHRSRNVAGKDFRIFGDGLDTLQPFGATFGSFNLVGRDHQPDDRFLQTNIAGETVWTPLALPPNYKSVAAWLGKNEGIKSHVVADGGEELAEIFQPRVEEAAEGLISLPPRRDPSQLEGPTPDGIYGFKFNENKTDSITHTQQYVTLLSVECHVTTRDQLRPDPAHDPVEVIFYCFQTQDHARFPSNGNRKGYFTGMIRVDRNAKLRHMGLARDVVEDLVATEEDLFRRFKDLVLDFDPEILVGYELQSESWGYLLERAAKAYEIDLCVELSRVRDKAGRTRYARDDDDWGYKKASSVHIDGRIVLNVWRLLRAELNLTSYNLENVVYHILHHRIPHFSFSKLTEWYNGSHLFKGRTLEYYLDRVQKNLELLDDTDLIGRTSEFARVFGVEFYSVISRGSQFKVESVMARIAKPRNFALFSPSRKQVANQRAAEALPLILEPESAFYPDPVVVLDFQSLYPSVMIAYNYCYSTCLGRTASVGKPHQLGAQLIEIAPEVVEALKDHINGWFRCATNILIFCTPLTVLLRCSLAQRSYLC